MKRHQTKAPLTKGSDRLFLPRGRNEPVQARLTALGQVSLLGLGTEAREVATGMEVGKGNKKERRGICRE